MASLSLSAALLSLAGSTALAGQLPPHDIRVLRPPAAVEVSTVSAPAKQRINDQIPQNQEYVLTDKSLANTAVGPGFTLIPLPALAYNRNEGAWTGALLPLFRANDKGQVEDIICPVYLHNNLIGETFTLNYFGYRHATQQYHLIASHATRVEHTLDFSYSDLAAGDSGRYIVLLQANTGKSAFNRFYGFGNLAPQANESTYAFSDSNLRVAGGRKFAGAFAITATERYERVSIEEGVVSTLPQTLNAYPNAPGLDGAAIWAQGLTLSFDTRDNPLTPLGGTYATLLTELNENYKTNNRDSWWRTTLDARHYWQHMNSRAVLVTHAMADMLPIDSKGLVRQGVPFYLRPSLGGETTLRGFGRGRYVSSFALLFNVEERLSVFQRSIMGNVIELELAPFVDMGRVGRIASSNSLLRDMQINPGLGTRLLARPNIAARLDVANGRDGTSVFVGLDYPF